MPVGFPQLNLPGLHSTSSPKHLAYKLVNLHQLSHLHPNIKNSHKAARKHLNLKTGKGLNRPSSKKTHIFPAHRKSRDGPRRATHLHQCPGAWLGPLPAPETGEQRGHSGKRPSALSSAYSPGSTVPHSHMTTPDARRPEQTRYVVKMDFHQHCICAPEDSSTDSDSRGHKRPQRHNAQGRDLHRAGHFATPGPRQDS